MFSYQGIRWAQPGFELANEVSAPVNRRPRDGAVAGCGVVLIDRCANRSLAGRHIDLA